MSARAEAYELGRIAHVGRPFIVLPLEPGQVDQHGLRGWFAGQRRDRGRLLRVVDHRGLHHDTGHALTCQMSAAYSAMVRSLENLPELATFRMALRAHSSESAYSVTSRRSASRYEVNVGQVHVVVAPGQEHVAQ